MYKIIITFIQSNNLEAFTRIYTYNELEDAIKFASTFKDRIISMGNKITLLRIYKTEEIGFPEMI